MILGIGSWKCPILSKRNYFFETKSFFGTVANQRCYFLPSLSGRGISANLAGDPDKEHVPKVS